MEPVLIVVSPSTINLDSHGVWVTVHADIPYVLVDVASVTLDGVPVNFTKDDDCDDLVAKFSVDSVRPSLSPGPADLTLRGVRVDGVPFEGTDTVQVIQVSGKRN